jgi:hypothetical protein
VKKQNIKSNLFYLVFSGEPVLGYSPLRRLIKTFELSSTGHSVTSGGTHSIRFDSIFPYKDL